MFLCAFGIPLPIFIALPFNTGFLIRRSGKDINISCRFIEGAKIISFTGDNLSWLNREDVTQTRVVFKLDSNGKEAILRTVYERTKRVASNETGEYDILGNVDPMLFTYFDVLFELESLESLSDEKEFEEIKEWIEDSLRYFIRMYREVTQDDDITIPFLKDAPVITTYYSTKYKFTPTEIEAEFKPYKNIMNWVKPNFPSQVRDEITQQQRQELSLKLIKVEDTSLFKSLLLDAKELSQPKGEHDLAIITMESAFEVFLQQELIKLCKTRGFEGLVLGRGKNAKIVDYQQVIQQGSVREVLLEYVSFFAGQNIKARAPYNEWLIDAYERRNNIVHKGFRGYTKDEAGEAFTATVKFINDILDNLYPKQSI